MDGNVRTAKTGIAVMTREDIMGVLGKNLEGLRKYRVKRIGLFGSYGRGQQRKRSDVDLLVEFDRAAFDRDFTGYSDNYDRLRHELEKMLGRKVDLVTQEMLSPFIKPYVDKDIEYLETA